MKLSLGLSQEELGHRLAIGFYKWATHVYTGMLVPTGTEVIGDELVTNGGFDSDLSGWTAVPNEQIVEWSSGRAHIVSDGTFCSLTQYPITKDGIYLVTFDAEVVSGKLGVQYSGTIYKAYSTTQSVSYIWNALNGDYLQFKRGDVCEVYVDNISVREYNAGLLKDTGKQKQNLTINSGAMTLFNGADQVIEEFDVPLNTNTGFTIAFKKSAHTKKYIFGSGDWLNLVSVTSNPNRFRLKVGDTEISILYEDIFSESNIAFIVESNIWKLYIDGEYLGENSFPSETVGHLTVIADPQSSANIYSSFDGSLSSVIILPQALTPNQVKYLHDYPHKAVAHYNVNDTYTTLSLPDVTASLNMPLTEVGKYKIDYSKVIGVINGDVVSIKTNAQTAPNTVGLDQTNYIFNIHFEQADSNNKPQCHVKMPNLTDVYIGKWTVAITSGTAKIASIRYSGAYDTKNETLSVGTYTYDFFGTATDWGGNNYLTLLFDSTEEFTFDATVTIETRKATAYEVANYTTSCDLTQQEDGLQLIAFKQNNGILEKLQDDRMNLTGEETPALQLNMTDTELYENGEFTIGFVIKRDMIVKTTLLLYSPSNNKGLVIFLQGVWNKKDVRFQLLDGTAKDELAKDVDDNVHHILFTVSLTEMLMTFDGVDGTPATHNFVPSGLNFKDSMRQSPKGELTDFKIWKKALTAEERAKEWAKAQKTIAKLEEN